MIFIPDLMIDEKININRIGRIKRKMKLSQKLKGFYFLIMRKNSPNLLEIIDAEELYYRDSKETIYIIAITKSSEMATEFVIDTIEDLIDYSLEITKDGLYELLT